MDQHALCGEDGVGDYQLRLLDTNGKVFALNDFEAENAAAAIERARRATERSPSFELWEGSRLIHPEPVNSLVLKNGSVHPPAVGAIPLQAGSAIHDERRENPAHLRMLAAWYRDFAEKTGNPMIWERRLVTAEDLERLATGLEASKLGLAKDV